MQTIQRSLQLSGKTRRNIIELAIVFVNIRGLVLHQFVQEGQTVNREFYSSVLKRLYGNIRRKWPELWEKIHGFYTVAMCHCIESQL